MRACIFQQARDRCLASGFGHAMGFDSPAGRPAFEPSGPLSNPQHSLCMPSPSRALFCPLTRVVQLSSQDHHSGSLWGHAAIKGFRSIFALRSTIPTNQFRPVSAVVSDGGRTCACGSEWGWRGSGRAGSSGCSVSLFVVSQPLNMVSMYIYIGSSTTVTGPKAYSDP